ncbi:MAG: VCBS repeat-containing protein, partial [Phycisphaerae bacterium]|nr:VCBS repeat-containing protein [Gemmatimonadaceae bacterium]
GDGKTDLFVQERGGELMFFERVNGEWEWRSDKFQDIDVGEWYRFVDIDGDKLPDLFGEMRAGYIRMWRNAGTSTQPKFVALGDTIRDADGRAIVADRQNILNAVDIDCNGKLDLFIGQVQGVVDRYEQDGKSPDGTPRFRLLEPMWQGIEVLGPEATGGTLTRIDTSMYEGAAPLGNSPVARRHGANTLTFADISGRGVYDLFWGDFFEQGLLRFENTGTCAQPNLTSEPVRFPAIKPVLTSGYNAPTFADADGDGMVDLVVGVIGGAYEPGRTSIENLYFLHQKPKDTWSIASPRLIPTIDVGTESAPALADVNGDGLLDLVIGGKLSPTDAKTGTVTWFANVGSKTAPAFRERGVLAVRGDYNYVPAMTDLDGDGLMDMVVGTWRDRLQWYRNTGTTNAPAWTMADTALVTITRGTNSTPSFGDLNGDGLQDIVIGEASGTINLYRNVGSKTSPKFELVSDNFQSLKVGRRSAPTLVDMDADGTLDMLIGNGDGELQLWRGVGRGAELRFERDLSFNIRSYSDAIPAVGDLHGSGRLDVLLGTSGGGLRWFSPTGLP